MKPKAYSFQPQLQIGCYHVAQAPQLFVRKVELHEIMHRWIPSHQGEVLPKGDAYYVECHRQGFIDWKSCKVYTSGQLVGRNNVYVIVQQPRKRV